MGGLQKSEAGTLSTRPEVLGTGQRVYTQQNTGIQLATLPAMPDPEPPILEKDEKPRKRRTVAQWKAGIVRRGHFSSIELIRREHLGPVGLIGNPRVVIGRNPTWTGVWCERPVWGLSNCNRVFVNDNHANTAMVYAKQLAGHIRQLAEKAERRRVENKARFLNGVHIELEDAQRYGDSFAAEAASKRLRAAIAAAFVDVEDYSPLYEESGHGRVSVGYGCTWIKRRKGQR